MLVKFSLPNATFIFGTGFLLTAIAEELMFRGLVEHHLSKVFSPWLTILLQAVLFAFLGHQGFDLLTNLTIRVPLGIALSGIRRSTGSYSMSILAHFIYDFGLFLV
ncbi:CPBP family intramembrane glutamic endopeptidase [Convivina intestini]|uniref:CPBP family intramembrane glutamic endopeptidase n=1 Tax=Convivina intestini TaxID=1505726 RepID=UPI00200F55EA|nr:CPBP family intramembrane glutamic endopeptidase [Convivina intestini]